MFVIEVKFEVKDIEFNIIVVVEVVFLVCGCVYNNDVGCWDDFMKFSGRFVDFCSCGGGCY